MKDFYLYKGNRCSFTLKGIEHLKTKKQFKEVFDGLVDINEAWADVEKSRSKDSVIESENIIIETSTEEIEGGDN